MLAPAVPETKKKKTREKNYFLRGLGEIKDSPCVCVCVDTEETPDFYQVFIFRLPERRK